MSSGRPHEGSIISEQTGRPLLCVLQGCTEQAQGSFFLDFHKALRSEGATMLTAIQRVHFCSWEHQAVAAVHYDAIDEEVRRSME